MWSADSDIAPTRSEPASAAPAGVSLATLRKGESARVLEVRLPAGHGHGHDINLVLRLLEIGFVPGERVRVMALGPGGSEPIAVRVGGTLFALRRHEAEHILVQAADESR
ncbi:MAG: ferrous iron transport protein A [Rhodanobacteraceae bacterium]|nr:ferrous iron transport protein A [Rhodanobacteraceae bacterium]